MTRKKNRGINGYGTTAVHATPVPAAISNRVGNRRVGVKGTHTEEGRVKLADLAGSTTFTATRFQLNPGVAGTFGTRLANIASGYEKYCFLKDLRVEYVPSQAVTTTAGTVWLGFDYDPMDAAPTTDAAFSTYETWVSTNVFNKMELDMSKIRAFDGVQHKKIRSGPVGGDLTLFDPGSLIVATDDCAGTSDLGKLYLHYSFVFFSPQTAVARVPSSRVFATRNGNETLVSGVAETVVFQNILANGMGLEIDAAVTSFTLPTGIFMVTGQIALANASAAVASTYDVFIFLDGIFSKSFNVESNAGGVTIVAFGDYIEVPVGETRVLTIQGEVTAGSGTLTIRPNGTFVSIEAL